MYSLAQTPRCEARLSLSPSSGTVKDLPSNVSCVFLDGGVLVEKKVPSIYAKHCPSQSPFCFKAPLA